MPSAITRKHLSWLYDHAVSGAYSEKLLVCHDTREMDRCCLFRTGVAPLCFELERGWTRADIFTSWQCAVSFDLLLPHLREMKA